jgi:hypothetical protein
MSDRSCKFSDSRQPRSLRELDARVAKIVLCSFSLIDVNRKPKDDAIMDFIVHYWVGEPGF